MFAIIDSLPKRPLLVLVMAVLVWGSLASFLKFRASLPTPEIVENVRVDAQSVYSISITLTFDAQGDAFSPLALRVSLDGVEEPLYESNTTIAAGVPILISPVAGIKVGVNELLVEVGSGSGFAAASQQQTANAIRVQVLANEEVIIEQTLWSEPGNTINGLIVLDVPENAAASASPTEHEGHQH